MNKLTTQLMDIHNIKMDSALDNVRGMSLSEKLDVVVTPNIDHLARLCEENVNPEFHDIYKNASLCLCDSNILEKLLRLKGMKVEEVIPGSTLTEMLFDSVMTSDDVALVVGGSDDVIARVREKYPRLNIKHYNPPMGFINRPEEVTKTLQVAVASGANYFYLAVGSPRQEILAKKLQQEAGISGVALCIGASILFLVGEEKRAPKWIQNLHLEWFYRMMQDPARLAKRYGKNFLSLPLIYKNI